MLTRSLIIIIANHFFKDLAIAMPAIAAIPTPTAIHVSVSSVFSTSFRCF
jgi:hypothetical protein